MHFLIGPIMDFFPINKSHLCNGTSMPANSMVLQSWKLIYAVMLNTLVAAPALFGGRGQQHCTSHVSWIEKEDEKMFLQIL